MKINTKKPILEVASLPRSPWVSISYVQDQHVLGTKLGCNKKDWVQKKQDGNCF